MDWKKIFSIFDGAINIEKTYKLSDKAVDLLKKYNKNPDAFKGVKKRELEETVQQGYEAVKKILDKEGQKNWPGVFREMHESLANIYMYKGKYEESKEEIEKLRNFGQVGKLEAERIMKELKERQEDKKERDSGEEKTGDEENEKV